MAVSYLFYASWYPPHLILLLISTLVDRVLANKIHVSDELRRRRFYLTLSLCANLGMLSLFKYGSFAIENINTLFHWIHLDILIVDPAFQLPIGISFYTFQTLSYTLDVYRKKMKPSSSFLDYALYVGFFPQLVAGPIVRAIDFIPQCKKEKNIQSDRLAWGLFLLLLGLFQKVIVADTLLSPVVEQLYMHTGSASTLSAWAGVMAFAMQIYFDFSGYTHCAMGAASCFGFQLPRNFDLPYAAVGFSDFWKRWHISLSSWLRDYLYISIGGNRYGLGSTFRNLSVTMLLGGLWHGASWLFVLWGALHGIYLVIEHALKVLLGKYVWFQNIFFQCFLWLTTFVLVCFSWVLFRSQTLSDALAVFKSMIFLPEGDYCLDKFNIAISLSVTGAVLLWSWIMRKACLYEWLCGLSTFKKTAFVFSLFICLITIKSLDRAFIYFQF